MEENKDTRFILLAAAGLLVCVLLLFLAWSRLAGPDSGPDDMVLRAERPATGQQQIVPVPGDGTVAVATSSVRAQELQGIMESWQEETVVASESMEVQAQQTPPPVQQQTPPAPPDGTQDRYLPADLSGLGFERQAQTSVGSGGPLPISLPSSSGGAVPETMTEREVLPDSSPQDCGTLTIPASAFGIAFFSTGLSRNPEVICMGEAVADNCDMHALSVVSSDGLDGTAYIAEDPGGQCGVGFQDTGSDVVVLCDLLTILNETYSESFTWAMWRQRFDEDPGGWMSGLISSNFGMLTNPAAADTFGCVEYALE